MKTSQQGYHKNDFDIDDFVISGVYKDTLPRDRPQRAQHGGGVYEASWLHRGLSRVEGCTRLHGYTEGSEDEGVYEPSWLHGLSAADVDDSLPAGVALLHLQEGLRHLGEAKLLVHHCSDLGDRNRKCQALLPEGMLDTGDDSNVTMQSRGALV